MKTERFNVCDEIPNYDDYVGYLWYSDATKPIIIDKKPVSNDKLSSLPFVIEGNLFSAKGEKSIQIKNIDGKYHIAEINLKGLIDEAKAFVGHDLDRDYLMVQGWKKEKDPLCADMTTMQPTWNAFAGFTTVDITKK